MNFWWDKIIYKQRKISWWKFYILNQPRLREPAKSGESRDLKGRVGRVSLRVRSLVGHYFPPLVQTFNS